STTTLGNIRFDKPDTYTISIKPTFKKSGGIMNLRKVTLKPVKPN
ncbi:MAG: hypothetical protein H7144_10235, partial [Burkholderiales bacterium]|nr:hypothetical protein [Phycisphaerae bacterium]